MNNLPKSVLLTEHRAHSGGSSPRPRRFVVGFVKLAIALALLGALIVYGRLDFSALAAFGASPLGGSLAVALTAVALPIGALRWWIVLRALGNPLRYLTLLNIFCIGTFANLFLPGGIGGDALRLVYAARAGGKTSPRILGIVGLSLIIDRGLGLLGLILAAVASMLLSWQKVAAVPALLAFAYALFSAIAVAGLGGALILVLPQTLAIVGRWLEPYPRAGRLLGLAQNVTRRLRLHIASLAAAMALSVLIYVTAIASLIILAGLVVRTDSLQWLDLYVASSLALVVNSVPLAPGGLGVGEAAFDTICRWLESSPSGTPFAGIFFAFRAASLPVALVGLISFVSYRVRRRASLNEPSSARSEQAGAR